MRIIQWTLKMWSLKCENHSVDTEHMIKMWSLKHENHSVDTKNVISQTWESFSGHEMSKFWLQLEDPTQVYEYVLFQTLPLFLIIFQLAFLRNLDSSFSSASFLHAVVRWKGLVETKEGSLELCGTFVTKLCPSLKLNCQGSFQFDENPSSR